MLMGGLNDSSFLSYNGKYREIALPGSISHPQSTFTPCTMVLTSGKTENYTIHKALWHRSDLI